MHASFSRSSKGRLASLAAAIALTFSAGSAVGISQSGEANNMQRVGHTDLQGRAAYQPNVIVYPDGRTIAFAGTHSGSEINPLNHNIVEPHGTMIIDVTEPNNPVEKCHIPGTGSVTSFGQSQMARMCLGSDLPHSGTPSHVYLMRNVQGGPAATQGYEVWDVTNVQAPVKTSTYYGIRSSHKLWWECKTGIAYMPGSKSTGPSWRQSQSMVIVDWSNPNSATGPIYLRTFGLPGGQPCATLPTPCTSPIPPSLHGAISAYEHPNAGGALARAATTSDVIGNRVYAAWGVG